MTRIALAQMCCEKAAIAQNLQQIADLLAQAEARGVDIVALPEMCLTGYADPTRYPEAVLRLDGPERDQLASSIWTSTWCKGTPRRCDAACT